MAHTPAKLPPAHRRPKHGLMMRILALNFFPLLILGIGILYLGQYRDSLIDAELKTLQTEGQLLARLITDHASFTTLQNSPQTVTPYIESLAKESRMSLSVYNVNAKPLIQTVPDTLITPTSEKRDEMYGIGGFLAFGAELALKILPFQTALMPYSAANMPVAEDIANSGNTVQVGRSWKRNDTIWLTVLLPLRPGNDSSPYLLVGRYATTVDDNMYQIRVDIIRFFFGACILTFLLSVYMATLIGTPLKRLVRQMDRVRNGEVEPEQIPDLSYRNDEIGELSVALRQLTITLYERLMTIDAFAADVAHELKNPLTSLQSAVETLGKVKKEQDRKRLLDVIQHDVRRLNRLITDISRASRLENELLRDTAAVIDVRSLLTGIKDQYVSSSLPENRIVLMLPDMPVMARINRQRIEQVICNLVDNALSFSRNDEPVQIRLMGHHKKAAISIVDSGPGIPEDKLEEVFTRFYTDRPDHESYGEHSGLGLSIARQIAEAHGGTLIARNVSGDSGIQGAEFILTLPGEEN